MKRLYRISPKGRRAEPTEAEIAAYRDPKRLLYNYQKAAQFRHRKPLYRDPRAFFGLLLIVALAWFLADVVDKQHHGTGTGPDTDTSSAPVHSEQ
ncbi:MAG: hypothetical protein ABI432_04105 [Flavobacteriales bacterium]